MFATDTAPPFKVLAHRRDADADAADADADAATACIGKASSEVPVLLRAPLRSFNVLVLVGEVPVLTVTLRFLVVVVCACVFGDNCHCVR